MKYRLKRDLPFMQRGNVFELGTWVGGGWGVDRGTTRYPGGGSSHNGVTTFNKHENALLDVLIDNYEWVEKVPQTDNEWLDLYDSDCISRKELITGLTGGPA